jgi:hypothetical protein
VDSSSLDLLPSPVLGRFLFLGEAGRGIADGYRRFRQLCEGPVRGGIIPRMLILSSTMNAIDAAMEREDPTLREST